MTNINEINKSYDRFNWYIDSFFSSVNILNIVETFI